ncbi:Coatomer beta subunit [Trema orientale]|uniref:Coatomer beta subunit n=1 Tax=Trema orientale TaxID=63057 RepID=A0A2P5FZV4_TREOI|nr:Coatomer beta subunit [Trema orientale]
MAAIDQWQPRQEKLWEVCGLLVRFIRPSADDKFEIWQKLQEFIHIYEFNTYLTCILALPNPLPIEPLDIWQVAPMDIRQVAGLLLKNNLRTGLLFFKTLQHIKSLLLPLLVAADRNIRSTVGTIVSTLVQVEGLVKWPELLDTLSLCLDSSEPIYNEGAMDVLSKICEDIPEELDSEIPGLPERPIKMFLPRLFKLFQSPHPSLRKLSLGFVNHYITLMPTDLSDPSFMDQYLQGLSILASDSSSQVRKLPHLRNVISYMLQLDWESGTEVALEACEFWSACGKSNFQPNTLREYLPELIQVLFSYMVCADDDESVIDDEENNFNLDSDQQDDNIVNQWNLRERSKHALSVLSNVFGDEILLTLMPLVHTNLSNGGDEAWKVRKAAVLALGTIANKGCTNGLYQHLSKIVVSLIYLLDDKFPLIRSISCRSLSRLCKFIVQDVGHAKGYEQFAMVVMSLLNRILMDPNKLVQEAACSAFATLVKVLAINEVQIFHPLMLF